MVDDPYKVLGISKDATKDEIKSAYRKKAKEYHPDLHPDDPEAAQKMNEVNEAYDMLMNPEKYTQRRQQQQAQQQARQQAQQRQQQSYYGQSGGYRGSGWYSDFDFDDFFNFGGADYGRNSGPSRPEVEVNDSQAVRQAVDAINQGQYAQALNWLNAIPSTGRNARWYYLHSLANQGAGNTVSALEEIQKACRMDTENTEYRRVYQQMAQAGQTYRQNGRGFNMDSAGMHQLCMGLLCLWCFCGGGYGLRCMYCC